MTTTTTTTTCPEIGNLYTILTGYQERLHRVELDHQMLQLQLVLLLLVEMLLLLLQPPAPAAAAAAAQNYIFIKLFRVGPGAGRSLPRLLRARSGRQSSFGRRLECKQGR